MKKILLVIIVLFFAEAKAQTVSPDSAKYFEGKEIAVCGKITSSDFSQKEKATAYFNFGPKYPKQSFTVIIWNSDLKNFNLPPASYVNKNVCVTGTVQIFNKKPQMIIKSQEQIKIIQ